MQPPEIRAFRKRLKKRGYRDIKISRNWQEQDRTVYWVEAVEPLAGVRVTASYTLSMMYHAFRF